MTVTEAQRFAMHSELKKALGDDVADTMMEHLPPTGWADVARKDDVETALGVIRRDIERVEKRLNTVITVGIAFGLALLALQVQIMLSIASL
jgi:hypothetical protein